MNLLSFHPSMTMQRRITQPMQAYWTLKQDWLKSERWRIFVHPKKSSTENGRSYRKMNKFSIMSTKSLEKW